MLIVSLLYLVGTIVGRARGYAFGGSTIVRCRRGHLFTTIWIPGISVKSIRLGWWRIQRCPVGHHWTVVVPVRDADLGRRERQLAHGRRDFPVP